MYRLMLKYFGEELRVTVDALPADGVLESARLPGFHLPLAELFAALDR